LRQQLPKLAAALLVLLLFLLLLLSSTVESIKELCSLFDEIKIFSHLSTKREILNYKNEKKLL